MAASQIQHVQGMPPSWPVRPARGITERVSRHSAEPLLHIAPGEWVIDTESRLGRVVRRGSGDGEITVSFPDRTQDVHDSTVRKVLPVTVIARLIDATDSPVTAWALRKANEQRTIQPDAIGHFAGHKVHYYDPARIPAIVHQLSSPDLWCKGTLVLHPRYGAGVIAGLGPQGQHPARVVEFFGPRGAVSVPVPDLRRLVPSHNVAKAVGVNRRAFQRLAYRRGIYPDYIAPDGRIREFYDETRIDQIRKRWSESEQSASPGPRVIVLDAEREVVRIESRDAQGHAHVRDMQIPAPARVAHVSSLQELVSLRELARIEQMSRYKLTRLLTAVGITPVYQHGQTLYFDRAASHAAIQARLHEERHAVALRTLADRVSVSEAILANKIRRGYIRTIGHHAAHQVSAAEAERVTQVVRANRSGSDSLESLGICRVQPRGRAGAEVVAWDIRRLLDVVQSVSHARRTVLFDQIGWMCEGAGQRRFREALDAWLTCAGTALGQPETKQHAYWLLRLIGFLPVEFARDRIRLLLISRNAVEIYRFMEERLQTVAAQAGCDNRGLQRIRAQMDQSLTDFLQPECVALSEPAERSSRRLTPGEDECTKGAMIVPTPDRNPAFGVIVRVEQQCWDSVLRRWHKVLTVRFADGERQISACSRPAGASQTVGSESVLVLLRASDVATVRHLVQTHLANTLAADQTKERWTDRKAS